MEYGIVYLSIAALLILFWGDIFGTPPVQH